ncbi:MAG: hypothetical protein KC646_02810 [Candidatus Cloacimonetes bacterium]|nr:hypothetical protein [Candidatus Cloacimonadota bacterium]
MKKKISKTESPLNEGLFLFCQPCEEKLKDNSLLSSKSDIRKSVRKLMEKRGLWSKYRMIKSRCHGNCTDESISILACGIGSNKQNCALLCHADSEPKEILDHCLQIMQNEE